MPLTPQADALSSRRAAGIAAARGDEQVNAIMWALIAIADELAEIRQALKKMAR